MAKARPSRKAAPKRGRKPAKPVRRAAKRRGGGEATSKRPVAKGRSVANPRGVAAKGPGRVARVSQGSGQYREPIVPEMQPPPLPAPIASFTF
jgi:hypothetical protein